MNDISTEKKLLNGLQLGTYITVELANYHDRQARVRIPVDVNVEVGDLIAYVAGHEGDSDPKTHRTREEHLYDFGTIIRIDNAPHPEADRWMLAKIDVTAYDERRQMELDTLEKLRAMELSRQQVVAVEQYSNTLPENQRSAFAAIQALFGINTTAQIERAEEELIDPSDNE